MTKIFIVMMCTGSLASAADLRVEVEGRKHDKEMRLLSQLPVNVIEGETFVSFDVDDSSTKNNQILEDKKARLLCKKCTCAAVAITVAFVVTMLARHYS